jgi:hypothetical protein
VESDWKSIISNIDLVTGNLKKLIYLFTHCGDNEKKMKDEFLLRHGLLPIMEILESDMKTSIYTIRNNNEESAENHSRSSAGFAASKNLKFSQSIGSLSYFNSIDNTLANNLGIILFC